MSQYRHFIGVDYSGAGQPTARLPGIRVFKATHGSKAAEKRLKGGSNWSRTTLTEWLGNELESHEPALIGLDHCYSFPSAYFHEERLNSWEDFLRHFVEKWGTATKPVNQVVDWSEFKKFKTRDALRLTEQFTSSAKSVFKSEGPSLFSKRYESLTDSYGKHAHDAYAVCQWLREMDELGFLSRYFTPPLTPGQRKQGEIEGWILGVA